METNGNRIRWYKHCSGGNSLNVHFYICLKAFVIGFCYRYMFYSLKQLFGNIAIAIPNIDVFTFPSAVPRHFRIYLSPIGQQIISLAM